MSDERSKYGHGFGGTLESVGPLLEPRVPSCDQHGETQWCECWNCGGDGLDGHDCGEDCCPCLEPEDNVRCDTCSGKGGWWRCYTCAPETEDEYA